VLTSNREAETSLELSLDQNVKTLHIIFEQRAESLQQACSLPAVDTEMCFDKDTVRGWLAG